MQPTERKHKKDEELISHIRHVLKDHEEVYSPGAWEKFSQNQNKSKRSVLWVARWGSVAALLALSFFIFWNRVSPPQDQLLSKGKVGGYEGTTSNSDAPRASTESLTRNPPVPKQGLSKRFFAYQRNNTRESLNPEEREPMSVSHNTNNSNINNEAVTDNIDKVTNRKKEEVIAQANVNASSVTDFLAAESRKNGDSGEKLVINRRQKKWEMGLMLAPSFGNTDELSLGYGLNVSYHLNDRISLNSGVAYNKMNARKHLPTNIGMSSVVLGNTKSLEMISEEVTGIDIPLELRYNINKSIYANLGISGFAVLSQNRNNTFVEEVMIKSNGNTSNGSSASTSNGGDGQDSFGPKGQFANAFIVNQRTTEKVTGSAMNKVDYMGFYNISIGYTRRIYKNNSISIEPFIKLPINQFSQDNLQLVGKGVRLRVGF